MTLNLVTEEGGAAGARGIRTFLPDDDVIEDLCAVLSLLSRRLVSAVTKTIEKHSAAGIPPWLPSEVPMPILDRAEVSAWRRRPVTIVTGWTHQEFLRRWRITPRRARRSFYDRRRDEVSLDEVERIVI
jgi:hypothetical protein